MEDDFGPVIGGRVQERRPTRILPCPCGDDASWYWEPSAEAPAPPDDLPPNLCESCFPLAVPEDQRTGWRRVPPPDEW